ncbi:MAG: LamG-like jellyroll fold domain-containing protein [Planctomycetota bacterium]
MNEGPSDLALDGNTVAENDAGATVGTLSSFDPDAGDTVTYTVSDDRFEVVDGELRLAEGVELNHEEAASIEVTVTATDAAGDSTEETFEINVTDINEGPSDLVLDGNTVAENDVGATVGTLSSYDPDAGDTVTYTASDDRFEVVDGELRLAEGVELNHEEAASIEVTVIATDSAGASTEETFEINVADVNEGPSDLALDGNTVAENDAGATVGTLSSFDPDAGDSVTYTVSDDRFEVVDGELRLAEGVELNHEEAASIEVTVTATDGSGLETSEAFEINVADVNEGPTDLALDGNTVAESDAGATVGTLSSFDPDAGDTVAYTVSDDRFEVVEGELRLADGVELDHEEAASLEVTVTATDSSGSETSETFEINVADVNEGPSDLALDGNTVSENDAGATVGTLSSFDPDAGETVAYSVSDERFEVVDGELRLAEGVDLNHEDAASIEVTVTATDSDGASIEETFEINVADVNEGPSELALDGNTVAENETGATVGTLSSFDPDAGDTVTYTVSDDRFEVVDGELRLAEGVELNHEEISSLEVTVTATDEGGLSTEETFEINVADVNEGPTDLTLANGVGLAESDFSAGDGHSGESLQQMGLETDAIVFTMSFTTSDDVSSTQTLFETGGSVYGTNVVIEDGMLHIYAGEGNDIELSIPIEPGTSYSFALELDTESDTIRVLLSDELPLEEMNAENSLVASLDDWTDRDYTGSNQMGVGDVAGGSAQGRVGGQFLGEIEGDGLQVFSDSKFDDVFVEVGVAENTEGVVIGTLSSFDPDAGDTVTYSVSDERFEVIDGEIRLAEGVTLDHETESSIDLTVTATDSGGLTTTETFEIEVADLNDGPTDLSIDTNVIDENSAEGVVGTVSVSDQDAGDTHTYRLVDNDGQPFSIDPETGEISVITPGMPDGSVLHIDASDADSVTLDGGVSGISDLSDTGNTIRQTNADQRPEFTEDGPFGGPGLQFDGQNDHLDISDNSEINLSSQSERSFALTIQTGEDVESRQVIYEEGGTVNGFNFYIDDGQLYMGAWSESTGWDFQAITVDVEPGTDYSIVTVYDGASNTYTAFVNGEEVGSLEVGDTMSAHSGNIGLGGLAQHTVFHDGDNSSNDGYYFEGAVGEFAVYNDALSNADVAAMDMDMRGIDPEIDFETQDSYDVTVEVTDSAGETYQETITINVADLNEGPIEIGLSGDTVAENEAGAVVGSLSSFDPDAGDTVTYTVSDDRFEVVGGELRLAEGVELDHEDAASLEVTVTATDSGGLESSETFEINVADVNEGPSDLALDSNAVAENQSGAVVGTISSYDPDAGDTVTYTVSDDRFEVVDGELRLAEGVELDHEDAGSIEVTVTATDSAGLETSSDFTIDVQDVNEAPQDVAIESAGENLVTGGSFEEQSVASGRWAGFGEDQSGNWDSANGIEVWDNLWGTEAADGNQFLELDYTGAADAISQTVTTEPGKVYTLSLDVRARGGADTDSIEVYWNGELIDVIDPGSTDWETVSFDVVGTGGDDVLEFREVEDQNDGLGAHMDNISLVEVPLTVVENVEGATIGTVSSMDPDAGDTVTYTVSDDRFEVVDGELRLAEGESLDFETEESVDVTVIATDSAGLETTSDFSINVQDVDDSEFTLSLNQDGGTDDVAMSASVTDFPTDAITVEVTFTADAMPAGSGAPLFSYAGGGGWGNDVLLWAETGTGELSVFLGGNKYPTGISNADLFDGEEHTVSLAWDQETGDLTVYVDGVPEYSSVVSVGDLPSNGTIVLGQEQDSVGGGFDDAQIFEGQISDVRIYDEALSEEQIADNAAGNVEESGLVTNWVMDEAVDGVVSDLAGDNDLVLQNDAEIVTETDTGSEVNKIEGTDGDDVLTGTDGNDDVAGGAGDDLFVYEADGGSDSFDGGEGWTDTVDLSNAVGDDAVYGEDWTVVLTEGEILSESSELLELSDDASGYIQLENGDTIDFTNIEQIGF